MLFLFLVFSQIGWLVFLLSLDLVLSREAQQCGSIVVGITASCDTAYNWAFFLWCTIPVFPPSWLLLWCSFLLNRGWHLPSYFSANCPYAVDLRLASLLFLVSGLSERLAWVPLVLLLEQLVPIWDREDAANEVKQLALVWSSKHRHGTVKHRERERASVTWAEQEIQCMERWERYTEWDKERVRQIDPLIMHRPLEMPNGEWSLQANAEWCDETTWYTASQRCKRDNKSIRANN